MSKKQKIYTKDAPDAIGPYSQGIHVGHLWFFSGQIPLDPKTGAVVGGGIKEQTEQVMCNIQSLLRQSDLEFSDVVKTTIYLKNMGDFAVVNEVYGARFKDPYPARSTVEVARLPKDVLVEIEILASRD